METTNELLALFDRAREFAEREYQAGVGDANRRIENASRAQTSGSPDHWLHQAIRVADDRIVQHESCSISPKWATRGYRDSLVEYRDSVGDV